MCFMRVRGPNTVVGIGILVKSWDIGVDGWEASSRYASIRLIAENIARIRCLFVWV